jgi:hypothetical protein
MALIRTGGSQKLVSQVECYGLWRFGCSRETTPFEVAICCRLFHLGVSIGIGRMCIFFVILYLSVYMPGRSFLMLCIGKCVGSLNMYGSGFGCSNGSGGGS